MAPTSPKCPIRPMSPASLVSPISPMSTRTHAHTYPSLLCIHATTRLEARCPSGIGLSGLRLRGLIGLRCS
eukprot:9473409-Pyramimonas_sp.AAC.1